MSTPYVGGEDRRTLLLALLNGGFDRRRREMIDGRTGRKLARRDADHALVVRRRRDVIRLRAQQRRSAGGKPRFRLRHIGARDLADTEAVAGLLQLLGEDFDVAPVEFEDRLVA